MLRLFRANKMRGATRYLAIESAASFDHDTVTRTGARHTPGQRSTVIGVRNRFD